MTDERSATRRLGELVLLRKREALDPHTLAAFSELSTDALWLLVATPPRGEHIRVYAGEQIVLNGNHRVFEMQRRLSESPTGFFHADLLIPVLERSRVRRQDVPEDYR